MKDHWDIAEALTSAARSLTGEVPRRQYFPRKWIVYRDESLTVSDPECTARDVGDRVVDDERVVLADVVGVGSRSRVDVVGRGEVEATVAIVRHVLLVRGPRDVLRLEEIDDGRYIRGELRGTCQEGSQRKGLE